MKPSLKADNVRRGECGAMPTMLAAQYPGGGGGEFSMTVPCTNLLFDLGLLDPLFRSKFMEIGENILHFWNENWQSLFQKV